MSFVVYGPEHMLNLVGDAEQRRAIKVDASSKNTTDK